MRPTRKTQRVTLFNKRRRVLVGTALVAILSAISRSPAGTIDGGTTETVPGSQASPWNAGPTLTVGDTGLGKLDIGATGVVTDTTAILGNTVTGDGRVTVSGTGATWTTSGSATIGLDGKGSLSITGGGTVTTSSAVIGQNAGSDSFVELSGSGSTWTNSGQLIVGGSGTALLTSDNGGALSTGAAIIGESAGGIGTVLFGTGSGPNQWTITGDLEIGKNGAGTLSLKKASTATVSGTVLVGELAGSTGALIVDGVGSQLTSTGSMSVGGFGNGSMTISNGATVDTGNLGFVGSQPSATGDVLVTGAGSLWAISSQLAVGGGGTGTLSITNGGAVATDAVLVGGFGATGTISISGAGSNLSIFSGMYLGGDSVFTGTGVLNISSGGAVTANGPILMATVVGSVGQINIGSAPGTAATAPGTLTTTGIQFGAGAGSINFNHTDTNYVFAPTMSGAGTINQIAGTTVLTGDSSAFTGVTNVLGGRLAVNGSLANSLINVGVDGDLGGTGTVGSINVSGTVSPGNSIGTLNVNGNVTFAAGSVYSVEANAAGQSDKIASTGTAALNGGTVRVLAATGEYAPSTKYTILTATGGVTGTFASVTSSLAFLTPSLTYDANDVYLTLIRNLTQFQDVGATFNQKSTGAALDTLDKASGLYGAAVQLDAVSARNAMDLLSGEVHVSAKNVLIEDSKFVREAAFDRLRDAFDAVAASRAATMAYASAMPGRSTSEKFTTWARGFGSWGSIGSDGNAAALKRDTGGILFGVDSAVSSRFRIGALGGYSHSTFQISDRASSGSNENYHLGLYGGTYWGDLAFRSGAAYTWTKLDTSRSVVFPGFSDSLKAGYNARTAQVFGEFGYTINASKTPFGTTTFEPFANLAYVNLTTDAFRESGGVAALSGSGSDSGVTFTTLGLRGATQIITGKGTQFTARGMAGWRHAYGDVTPASTMSFVGSSPFVVAGLPIAQDAAVFEAGVEFNLAKGTMLGLSYGGQFARSFADQSVKGAFRIQF